MISSAAAEAVAAAAAAMLGAWAMARVVTRPAARTVAPAAATRSESAGRRGSTGERRVVGHVVTVVVASVISIALGLAVAAGAAVSLRTAKRRSDRTQAGALQREMAWLAELFAASLDGGLGAAASLARVQPRSHGAVSTAAAVSLDAHARGRSFGSALELGFGPLGELGTDFASLVGSHHDDGAAAALGLRQWASGLRSEHHQRRLAQARRLPVRMLAPLVLCILPAFLLLTVVPVVVEGFRPFFT